MSRYDEDCMLCGRDWYSHHDFEPRAKDCKCGDGDWEDADEYPMICRKGFGPHKLDATRCENCEHLEACHPQKPAETPTP